jgi:prolipoprotein diacylglyceryl transferase
MDPIAFTILGIEIRWYGILIASSMFIGTLIALKRVRKIGITEDDLLDILLLSLPLSIIGARAYYVAFTWSSYQGDFMKMINFRNGGLAIHGGLLFAIIGIAIMSKKKNINMLSVMDLTFPFVALGQAIGRWGNYINQEAHGIATDLPWGIMVDGIKVHPTFLYESIGDFIIFIILFFYFNKRKGNGDVFFLYCVLYGILRFFVEGLRTDSLMFFGFRIAQIVSLLGAIIGLIIFVIIRRKNKDNLLLK